MVHPNKRLADLQRQAKRRAAMQVAQPQPIKFKASDGEREEMVRDHIDLLQNIEMMITSYADEHEIDDRVIRRALEAAIANHSPAETSPEHGLLELFAAVKESRGSISDTLWQRALRVVLTSVKNHSTCAPGETAYLDFIRRYT